MKIAKVVVGKGFTKGLPNDEWVKVYNELEATLEEGEKVADVQKVLSDAVDKLNKRDINKAING